MSGNSLIILSCLLIAILSLISHNPIHAAIAASSCPNANDMQDSPLASDLWQQIKDGNYDFVKQKIEEDPCVVHLRASDGRSPLFWAYEFNQNHIVQLLLNEGADLDVTDSQGLHPEDMSSASHDFDHREDQHGFDAMETDIDLELKQMKEQQRLEDERLKREAREKIRSLQEEQDDGDDLRDEL